MPSDEPSWWYPADAQSRGWQQRILTPVAWMYGRAMERRFQSRLGYRSRFPIICVGNFVAGGTGKTPLTQFIAARMVARNLAPVVLSRGYGGAMKGPLQVDSSRHRAAEVGDEPLLLSRTAPVVIARDRRAGVQFIEREISPASVVIMDDGLQNPSLKKDLSIALIDGVRGIGNGEVIPSGPLRGKLDFQLGLVDAIVVNGSGGNHRVLHHLKQRFPGPVLQADVVPTADTDWLKERPVLAYSGIANPKRFFALLERLGAELADVRTFGDHHQFKDQEAADLLSAAHGKGAQLVTTEKDWVRLSLEGGALADLQAASRSVPIRLRFADQDEGRMSALIDAALASGGYRRGVARA